MYFIDSTAVYLDEAQTRNFQKWPILGKEIWRSTPGVVQRNTYQKEVDYLKNYVIDRVEWMDEQLEEFTSIGGERISGGVIRGFTLLQNYPNPFNSTTQITYSLLDSGTVTLKVFDINGREVRTLVHRYQSPGFYDVPFDAGGLASGIYLYKLSLREEIKVKKMALVR